MANLFSMSSPLMIISPHGGKKVIAELYPHPEGIVFFEVFWNLMDAEAGVHVISGEFKGDGPWKVGDYVINVLGCQGSDPELAENFSQWQAYLQTPLNDYPEQEDRKELARRHGADV